MELNLLTAISPLDGRYRNKVDELDLYFSEFGLIRYRIMIEVEYFIALCNIPLPQLSDFKKDNFKIFCFLKETNKIIRSNIENIAAIKFFYDKYQPQPIENYLSVTEKDLSRTYNKIVKNRSIESLSKGFHFSSSVHLIC